MSNSDTTHTVPLRGRIRGTRVETRFLNVSRNVDGRVQLTTRRFRGQLLIQVLACKPVELRLADVASVAQLEAVDVVHVRSPL